eukprot:CAMPEP_0195513770 /NCGR_PEP_ID=MMETSP0794_2-20130614/5345_1 /TAXON_ID=515487 /ORGANISM="Stephanopyxis turris, Strain CCMP 815" /LENGTH=154 /DNA_ID=CAMNT_0040641863 /DNA_START=404 /DNA_END=868 /DNA_ORIENTATION=-
MAVTDTIIHHRRNIADTVNKWGRAPSDGNKKLAVAIGYDAPKRNGANAGKYASANMLDDKDTEALVRSNREEIERLKGKIKFLEADLFCKTDYFFDSEMYRKIHEGDDSDEADIFNESDEYIKELLKGQQDEIELLEGLLNLLEMELICSDMQL